MEYTGFEIENFRGIKKISIDLSRSPQANVFTLVGLNESGKTTILEALSRMAGDPINLSSIDPSKNKTTDRDYQSFVPVSERANFSGEIKLSANLQISSNDKQKIESYLKNEFNLKLDEISDSFTITQTILYEGTKFKSTSTVWTLIPIVKNISDPVNNKDKDNSKFKLHTGKNADTKTIDIWRKMVAFIRGDLLPNIIFFRNEVFEFPDRIYIDVRKPNGDKQAKNSLNSFYQPVIQDILHAINKDLDIQTHLIARKKSSDRADMQNLATTVSKMSHHVTKTIMRQWESIFKKKLDDKRIGVACETDEHGDIFIRFFVEDGGEIFDISDRSAGFRWFFAYSILTEYRGYRNHAALFLFDEPASSLHSAAQQQLLERFSNIPPHFRIIYSTHSHHLINPDWLDATYIVKNDAASSDNIDFDYDSSKTNITLVPYRRFVSENPSQVSYFQPILDLIGYIPSKLNSQNNSLLVEGKNDYYSMRYMMLCAGIACDFDILPCSGSGTADQLIALYSGWGKNFAVLLDSDSAGKKEKNRYIEKFGSLVSDSIIDYSDIDPLWDGFAMEKIIGQDTCQFIHGEVFPDEKFSKKSLNLAIQELLIKNKIIDIGDISTKNIKKIFTHVDSMISDEKSSIK